MEKRLKHFELKETKNYNQFKFYLENRPVDKKKVKKLKESIKEKGLKQAISVKYKDGLYYITDGQHRFTALSELGYFIVFVVDYDLEYSSEDIVTINSNRSNTQGKDYIHFYATRGYIEYVKLQELYDKYPKVKRTLINEYFIRSKKPKSPTFKISEDINTGNIVIDYAQGETLLSWTNSIVSSNNQNDLFQTKFARAIRFIYYNNQNFKIKRFCKKIRTTVIPIENNEYKIIANIKETYNKNLRSNEMYLS